MATIPLYDTSVLPCITYPIENTKEETKKYLGGKAFAGRTLAKLNLLAKSNAEMKALYEFWRDDCNYGLEPCLIPLAIFGDTSLRDDVAVLVKIVGDLTSTMNNGSAWKLSVNIEVLGTVIYVVDEFGQFILDDAGDFIITEDGSYSATGNNINSYKEVLYGNS